MAFTNYSTLKTAIATWLDDASIDAYIPDFITICEATLNRRARLQVMQKRAHNTLDTTTRYFDCPTNFAEMVSLRLATSPIVGIDFVTNQQIDDLYNSTAGRPEYYTVWGDELEFNRLPDSAYTIEMKYYQNVTALSADNTTNDILTYHPDLYLYGSLVAAEPFLAEDDRLITWKAMFDSVLIDANNWAKKSQTSGSALISRGKGLRP